MGFWDGLALLRDLLWRGAPLGLLPAAGGFL